MSRFRSLVAVAGLMLAGALACPAHALEVRLNGEVAVLSGSVDYPDVRRVREAHEQGVRVFVLRGVTGGDIDGIERLSRVMSELGPVVVLDGVCAGACPYLLMAGKERRFAASNGAVGVLIRSANYRGDLSGPAAIADVYVFMRDRLSEVISNALLRKHTNGYLDDGGLIFIAYGPQAGVYDCPVLKGIPDSCNPVPEADIVNTGVFTSKEPYRLAEPARQGAGK